MEDSPQKSAIPAEKQGTLVIDLDHENGLVLENGSDSSESAKDKKSKRVKTERPTKNGRYECVMCKQQFDTLAEKRAHWNTHKQGGLFRCIFCPAAYNKESFLLDHVKDLHNKVDPEHPASANGKSKTGGGRPKSAAKPRKSTKNRRDSDHLSDESPSESELQLEDDDSDPVLESTSDEDWSSAQEIEPPKKKRGGKRKQEIVKRVSFADAPADQVGASGGNVLDTPQVEPAKKRRARKSKVESVSDEDAQEDTPKNKRGRKSKQESLLKTPNIPAAPVVKVSSNKRITTTTPNGTAGNVAMEAAMAAAGRTSGRLRSKYRQYFY